MQAKLPNGLPDAALHLKAGAGGSLAVDPASAGWRYLSFRSFSLAEGEVARLDSPGQETALVTISGGGVELAFDDRPSLILPGRPSVFDGLPWSAYLPAGSIARVIGRPLPGQRAVVATGPGALDRQGRDRVRADRGRAGGRHDRDPRRRQLHPSGQQHHDARTSRPTGS